MAKKEHEKDSSGLRDNKIDKISKTLTPYENMAFLFVSAFVIKLTPSDFASGLGMQSSISRRKIMLTSSRNMISLLY